MAFSTTTAIDISPAVVKKYGNGSPVVSECLDNEFFQSEKDL